MPFRHPLLRQLTQEQRTNHLPAIVQDNFRKVAIHILTVGTATKAFRNIKDLEVTTLAPKIEGRITRIVQ